MTEPRRARRRDMLRDPDTGQWDLAEIRHRAKGWVAVAVALAVVVGGGWFVGTKAWNAFMDFRTKEDYIGAEGVADVEVVVPRGSTMAQIGAVLVEADVVKSADTFVQYARSRPDDAASVQAGTYRMRTQISAQAAFERLLNAANIVRNMIQLPEGMRLSEAVSTLAERSKVAREEFEAVLADPGQLDLPAWGNNNPEGFLYPDTYEIGDDPTALSVLSIPIEHFKKVAADLNFEERAAASPAGDAYSALIMASIVEREAVSEEDRAKVARVFYNRLAQGEPLQSDATVAYANNITGRVTTTEEERKLDSPYNTYLAANAGKLPPGPITSPERTAMEAAVSPAEGDWLFFVTVNLDTGETVFSNTYDEHLAAVAQWQAWCNESSENTKKCFG